MQNLYFKKALQDEQKIKDFRRKLHGFAEVGFELPKTTQFIEKELEKLGLKPQKVGKSGIVCTLGSGTGKTILLRADMDALPMKECSNLEFSAKNDNCHSCGHDAHSAMLLYSAKLLKENEKNLNGNVKFMFQPAEELLAGALDMIDCGVLENPSVDVAFGLHVNVADENSHTGNIVYSAGPAMFSGDAIKITVTGKDSHGSTPELGVDAINVASHIVIALQEIISREISCKENCVLLVGKISGGTTCNTVAGICELECSLRATTPEIRDFIKGRISEVASGVATTFRAKAHVDFLYGMPPLVTDVSLSHKLALFASDICGKENIHVSKPVMGTEDFTAIAERVPSAFFFLGAGSKNQGYNIGLHNPSVVIDENCLAYGASVLAHVATEFLNDEN